MWFSQFMLIWYANIPEEVTYFMERIELDNYRFLYWFSLAINFIVPTLGLMSRDAKRNKNRLIFVCIVFIMSPIIAIWVVSVELTPIIGFSK